ncbi:hypothetical protein ACQPZ2_44115 (plasmid) [Nocardia pseudovaccinii]|uniref:hypothetical protein n=1 Tax=Nocardia pseudovaccinii TaxID=189540 RepID=UPI003D9410AF
MRLDRDGEGTPGVDHVEEVAVTEQLRELRRVLAEGRPLAAGRLWGLPELSDGDVWVDIAGAAAAVGAEPRTITSWLTRRGPKRHPFPPAHRYLYRLYWPLSVIQEWKESRPKTGAAGLPR